MPRVVSGGYPKSLENVMIFIDGGYLRKLFNDLFGDDRINYDEMRNALLTSYNNTEPPLNPFRANLIRAYYYDGIAEEEPERTHHKEYFDSLRSTYAFITVRLGEAVKEGDGSLRQKGVDILMAVDALNMAYQHSYDAGLFFLGDRDFIPLIQSIKYAGKKTYGFFYSKRIAKELMWEFDYRIGFSMEKMMQWHVKKQEKAE